MAAARWTKSELAALARALASQQMWPDVAHSVGRSAGACWQKARTLGLFSPQVHVRHREAFDRQVLLLHSRGLIDREIAAKLGANLRVVGCHRRRLGLPSNKWNARQRMISGSRAGWFKPGDLKGQAAKRLAPDYSTRIRRRHTRWRKGVQRWIRLPGRGVRGRWVPFARFLWQRAHGPLPAGTFVVHANGDCLDDRIENLRAMTRRELPAWQASVRPAMEQRRRTGASRAARQRWAAHREIAALRRRKIHHGGAESTEASMIERDPKGFRLAIDGLQSAGADSATESRAHA